MSMVGNMKNRKLTYKYNSVRIKQKKKKSTTQFREALASHSLLRYHSSDLENLMAAVVTRDPKKKKASIQFSPSCSFRSQYLFT